MSRFDPIDPKLRRLADKLNACLRIDRPGYPSGLPLFQERRIDWTDGVIQKAILIQPLFEAKGVNDQVWSLTAIAWYDQTYPKDWQRLTWYKAFVEDQPFEVIANNIDFLLTTAENELTLVKMDDLHPLTQKP